MEIPVQGKGPDVYNKLKTKFNDYKAQGKLQVIQSIDWNDAACSANASGTGFKARFECKDDKIIVELDLNFLMKAMRGQIEEGIKKIVSKATS